jgi:CRP-like cAMP-binding protein
LELKRLTTAVSWNRAFRFGIGRIKTGRRRRPLERSVISNTTSHALIRRLQAISAIDDEDVANIRSLPIDLKTYEAGQYIVRDGERPMASCLLAEGFCIRSKTTLEGRRQILSIHIPGEIPDLQSLYLHELDHDLVTLTECRLGFIPHTALKVLVRQRPNVAEVLWRDTLIDAAMFREWIVNVGQRPAASRLAHIVVELRERLKVIGREHGDRVEMPLTQEQIGEAMGITPIHANRIIKQLREDGVLEFHRGYVTVLNENKLEELAHFDDRYLHLTPSQ